MITMSKIFFTAIVLNTSDFCLIKSKRRITMKKVNILKIITIFSAVSCLTIGLSILTTPINAKNTSGTAALNSPTKKTVTVKKKTYLYDKRGRKLNKKVLKKGQRIVVSFKTKKIKGQKYYFVTKDKFVLAKLVTKTKVKSKAKKLRKQTKLPNSNKLTNSDNQTQSEHEFPIITNFSITEFRQEFLKELNKERAQRGLSAVTEDPRLDEIVQERTKLLPANFSHNDSAGNFILNDFFNKAGVVRKTTAECIAAFPWGATVDRSNNELINAENNASSALVADNMLYEYIYNDAQSNWGHRDILLDPNDKTIGLGALADKDSGQICSSVGVIY